MSTTIVVEARSNSIECEVDAMGLKVIPDQIIRLGSGCGLLAFGPGEVYQARIKRLFGSDLIGYWPLDEASGTTIYDRSGNARNGAYTDIAQLGGNGFGPFQSIFPTFNNSLANVYSVGLKDAFNPDEYTVSIWAKMDAGVWGDATARYLAAFEADNSNRFNLLKDGAASTPAFTFSSPHGGTANVLYSRRMLGVTQWVNVICSYSASNNRMRLYINGGLVSSTTVAGTWAGQINVDRAGIGSHYGTVKSSTMTGNLGHCWVLNREITLAEAQASAVATTRLSFLGDSITANASSWADLLFAQYGTGLNTNMMHAVGSTTIAADLAGQVTAAEGDDADIIIIEMGTNDNNAGDMTALQATVSAQLAALKTSNPRATLYFMNVLPRWTDTGGGTVVDKSNIRAAIAAACAAQNVTCWDTFTTPWIAAADTADGLHPTLAGYNKIVTQVLTRL